MYRLAIDSGVGQAITYTTPSKDGEGVGRAGLALTRQGYLVWIECLTTGERVWICPSIH